MRKSKNLKKMTSFIMGSVFTLLSVGISASYAQSGLPNNLGMPNTVEQSIDDDCNTGVLKVFLDASGKTLTNLSDYQLLSVSCDATSASLYYEHSGGSISFSLLDNQSQKELMSSMGGSELSNTLLQMQKALLQTHTASIDAFDELRTRFPELAAKQEETSPPSVKLPLATGDALYYRRVPCEESGCGQVEAHTLIKNDRYFFEMTAENHAIANSKELANDFVTSVLQLVRLQDLP